MKKVLYTPLSGTKAKSLIPHNLCFNEKKSNSYRGQTVLFENLNGLGGRPNELFINIPFAQPIFRPKDNLFSQRQVLNQKSQNFGTPYPVSMFLATQSLETLRIRFLGLGLSNKSMEFLIFWTILWDLQHSWPGLVWIIIAINA